jgi:hypothetical protein
MKNFILWLLGYNIKKSSVMYIDIEGIAFTPGGVDAMVKNLRNRNTELEATNKLMAKELTRHRVLAQCEDAYKGSWIRDWKRVEIH